MKKIAIALAAVAASLISTGAMAQAYVSGAVGQGHTNVDCSGTTSCSNNGTAYRLIGGYGFSNGLAAELGYLSFGKAEASVSGVSAELKAKAVTLGVAFRAKVASDWELGARVGVASVKTTISGSVAGFGSGSDSQTKAQPYVGIGAGYALTKNLTLEASADFSRAQYEDEKADVRALMVGARYTF
jgi:OmpA-OmpF porin, OOP family